MEVIQPGGIGFYVLSILISGGLFLLWRRLFRRLFTSEAVIVIATAMASIITTPIVLLAILWLAAQLHRP
ncbi:MAG: hypothetical protein EOO57_08760 [Hymenobacter sp.]|nr:MAG: hypothetical protein EOO57_08760 [Hymenobacter sp.]